MRTPTRKATVLAYRQLERLKEFRRRELERREAAERGTAGTPGGHPKGTGNPVTVSRWSQSAPMLAIKPKKRGLLVFHEHAHE